jgi:AcrR family transcriptional regulator
VRQNVLYHHFGSKEQILGSLLEALVRPAVEAAEVLAGVEVCTEDDAAARLYALAFYDAHVLATWRWNLGVLFALPEAHSAVFDPAHRMRAQLRRRYMEFTESVATHTGAAVVSDHPFRLVESVAAIRADGQLDADTPHELALGCLRLAGRLDRLAAVAGHASALLESLGSLPAPELK